MAKDSANTEINDLANRAQDFLLITTVAGPRSEQFWQAQQAILAEAEAFSRDWFKRRHEAAETALKLVREMNANGAAEPAQAMRAMTDWQRTSLERMSADLRELVALCTRCAGAATSATADVASTGETADTEDGKQGNASSRAPAKSRQSQATPV